MEGIETENQRRKGVEAVCMYCDFRFNPDPQGRCSYALHLGSFHNMTKALDLALNFPKFGLETAPKTASVSTQTDYKVFLNLLEEIEWNELGDGGRGSRNPGGHAPVSRSSRSNQGGLALVHRSSRNPGSLAYVSRSTKVKAPKKAGGQKRSQQAGGGPLLVHTCSPLLPPRLSEPVNCAGATPWPSPIPKILSPELEACLKPQ